MLELFGRTLGLIPTIIGGCLLLVLAILVVSSGKAGDAVGLALGLGNLVLQLGALFIDMGRALISKL